MRVKAYEMRQKTGKELLKEVEELRHELNTLQVGRLCTGRDGDGRDGEQGEQTSRWEQREQTGRG